MAEQHWTILFGAAGVLALAWALEVRPDERVQFRIAPEMPLPNSCLSRSCLDMECPGCGLTRSLVCLVHGRFGASWKEHRVGWLLGLWIATQIPYRIWGVAGGRGLDVSIGTTTRMGYLLVVLLLANWAAKLVGF